MDDVLRIALSIDPVIEPPRPKKQNKEEMPEEVD
jgi:hypothetical protein